MSITQTVLVFAGIPAAVVAAVYAIVFATTSRRNSKRYRPGRPFTFSPVWFLAAPERVTAGPGSATALPAGAGDRELASAAAGESRLPTPGGAPGEETVGAVAGAARPAGQHGETGGASDSW